VDLKEEEMKAIMIGSCRLSVAALNEEGNLH